MLLEERILPRLDQLVGQPAFWQAVQAGNAECLELITDLLVTVLQWYARCVPPPAAEVDGPELE